MLESLESLKALEIRFVALNMLTKIVEITSIILCLVGTLCAIKEKIIGYPIGITGVGLYVYIFFDAQLYASAAINLYFVFAGTYGWYCWTQKKANKSILKVSYCSKNEYIIYSTAIICVYPLLLWGLNKANAPGANLEAFINSFYVIGMIMMARKKIENWMTWIIGDLVAIPHYYEQGLTFTALLDIIYIGIAYKGFMDWRKSYKKHQ